MASCSRVTSEVLSPHLKRRGPSCSSGLQFCYSSGPRTTFKMQTLRFVIFQILVFTLIGLVVSQTQVGSELDNQCIGCICEGASQCNLTAGCKDGMCGLFRITFPYWVDAGKPLISGDNPENPQAFQNCVMDPPCAGETVTNYVKKFRQDCNRDGKIDCRDFAAIHHLGGYGCGSRPLDQKYERQFEACLAGTGQVGG